jgi:hypothetical protein
MREWTVLIAMFALEVASEARVSGPGVGNVCKLHKLHSNERGKPDTSFYQLLLSRKWRL